ncbi:hypothetical protein ABBQ38_003997 [Trebouxia sp. C0009 RCD-2024]
MGSTVRIGILTACMLLTGSVNTIATKYQDITPVGHTRTGEELTFKHPAVQSAFMFLGETLCFLPYFFLRWRKQQRHKAERGAAYISSGASSSRQKRRIRIIAAFALPALCDAAATTLLNVGLYYTYASTFQMLRGTLVLWAGLLTILVLHRRLHIHNWFGMVLIVAGAAIVGASSIIYDRKRSPQHPPSVAGVVQSLSHKGHKHPHPDRARDPVLGDILVVVAQMAAALQFIIEEKYLAKYRVPALLGVGLEGMWGLLLSAIALPILSMVKGSDGMALDSLFTAFTQIANSWQLQASTVGSIVSIAFFNFFGLSVTKSLSGAARAAIDACRTILIWLFSVQVGWETFHGLQVLGFLILIAGTSMYNELLRGCLPGVPPPVADETSLEEPLLIPEALQPPPTAPQRPTARRPPSAPISRPALPQSIGSMPFIARSVRLFPHMFSPHSLASPPLGQAGQASLSDEDFVNQRQRWPGTTPSLHSGGVLRGPNGEASGAAMPSQPSEQQLSRHESDTSSLDGV